MKSTVRMFHHTGKNFQIRHTVWLRLWANTQFASGNANIDKITHLFTF